MIAKDKVEAAQDPAAQLQKAQEEVARLQAELEKARAAAPPPLDPLLKEIKKRYARFITDQVNPGHQERHRGDLSSWTPELFRAAGEMGLFALGVSPELGGDGRDPLATGIALEELAKLMDDPGFLVTIGITKMTANAVAAGRPDLIDTFVRPMVKGEQVACWAAWEPGDAGFLASSAKKDKDGGWILSGSKPFLTGGMYADLIAVVLREDATGEPILFLLRKNDPGLSMTPLPTVGARHLGFASMVMDKVRVGDDQMVLDTDALSVLAKVLDEDAWTLCAVHLGWMQRMLGLCIEDMGPKVRNGMRFLEIPKVQSEIGRLQIGVEVARAMFLRVMERYRSGKADPISEPLTQAFKYYLSERTIDTAQTLMRLQGGAGYLDENPWGRYVAHVLALLHVGGVQDMIPQHFGERFLSELELKKLRKFTM
jgi:alkylation response protein AidB-like acyl-CoA dehydrogenase